MCKQCKEHRSWVYGLEETDEVYPFTNQPMIRPTIRFVRVVVCVVSVLLIDALLAFGGATLLARYDVVDWSQTTLFVLTYLLLLLMTVVVFLGKIIIFFIKLYQRYVPFHIRCGCLFTPNCSQYMVLAIEKYGAWKGVRMGIKRFKRCREPNGGEDYP